MLRFRPITETNLFLLAYRIEAADRAGVDLNGHWSTEQHSNQSDVHGKTNRKLTQPRRYQQRQNQNKSLHSLPLYLPQLFRVVCSFT